MSLSTIFNLSLNTLRDGDHLPRQHVPMPNHSFWEEFNGTYISAWAGFLQRGIPLKTFTGFLYPYNLHFANYSPISSQYIYIMFSQIGGSLLQGRMASVISQVLGTGSYLVPSLVSPSPLPHWCHPGPHTMPLPVAQSPLHTRFRWYHSKSSYCDLRLH